MADSDKARPWLSSLPWCLAALLLGAFWLMSLCYALSLLLWHLFAAGPAL